MLHWKRQLRSFTNQDVVCALSSSDFVLAPEGHNETGLSLLLPSSSSLPLFLFPIFNYFLISEEKDVCGRRQFQSKDPGGDSQKEKATVESGSFITEHMEEDSLCLGGPPAEERSASPGGHWTHPASTCKHFKIF